MIDMDRQVIKERVLDILKQHVGPNNCIKKEALWSSATGDVIIPWRRIDQTRPLRSMIEALQRAGEPIAHKSGKGGGYFYADNPDDLTEEADWHHVRAMSSLRREKALRKITTPELLSQVALELNQEEPTQ
ncbi:MAG: hypothetical protein HY272_01830 [Gammaproteobacteria bacterium]|nr:hypothetical protein [Gammaproteobacteria bacterium]